MTLVLVPRRLLEDAQKAINTLADEVCGKRAAQWGVVNDALVGLGTALRVQVPESPRPLPAPVKCLKCGFMVGEAGPCSEHSPYPDRTCSVCHEDMNMQGGCRCNGYTMAGGPAKPPIR